MCIHLSFVPKILLLWWIYFDSLREKMSLEPLELYTRVFLDDKGAHKVFFPFKIMLPFSNV